MRVKTEKTRVLDATMDDFQPAVTRACGNAGLSSFSAVANVM